MNAINHNVLGIQLVMSQSDAIASEEDTDGWKYNLFGRFDRLRMDIFNNPESFYKSMYMKLSRRSTPEQRRAFLPETQKAFLLSSDATSHTRLNAYAEGNGKDYIAVIAIKFFTTVIDRKECFGNGLHCIKRKVDEYFKDTDPSLDIEVFVLQCLGIDDVYILVGMNLPDYKRVLQLVNALKAWHCDFDCNERVHTDDKDIKVRKTFNKAINELRLLSAEDDVKNEQAAKIINFARMQLDRMEKALNRKVPIISLVETAIKEMKTYWQYIDNQVDSYLHGRVLACIDAMRAVQSVPVVLRSHTVLGYGRDFKVPTDGDLDWCKLDSEMIHLRMALTLRPGASVQAVVDKKLRKKLTDIGLEPTQLITTIGREDYVWHGEVTPTQLIKVAKEWIPSNPPQPVDERLNEMLDYSSIVSLKPWKPDDKVQAGEFEGLPLDNQGDLRETILAEDIKWAEQWQEEQLKVATNLFNDEKLKPVEDHPVKGIIDEMSLLHVQGCVRFFLSFAWNEYKDARDFFSSLFMQLNGIFEDIEETNNPRRKEEKYSIVRDAMVMCLRKMSPMFHDRIILDKSMRENTRPGLYATGAYEKLLKRYGTLIEKMIGILAVVEERSPEDKQRRFREGHGFLLLPLSHDTIHTHHLFPWLTDEDRRLIIYEAPLEDMLNMSFALPLFAHEAGHYWGVTNRSERTEAFISHVATHVAKMVVTELVSLTQESPILDTYERYASKLAEALFNYLLPPTRNGANSYLNHLHWYCVMKTDNLVQSVPDGIEQLSNEGQALLKVLTELYHRMGIAHTITRRSRMFHEFLTDLMVRTLNFSRKMLREFAADLAMIRILQLTDIEYVEILNYSMMQNKKVGRESADSEEGVERHKYVEMCRVLSTILITSSKSGFKEAMSEIPDRIRQILNKYDNGAIVINDNLLAHLRAYVMPFHDNNRDEAINNTWVAVRDYIVAWNRVAPYMWDANITFKKALVKIRKSGIKERSDLEEIRSLYNEVKGILGNGSGENKMFALVKFLETNE